VRAVPQLSQSRASVSPRLSAASARRLTVVCGDHETADSISEDDFSHGAAGDGLLMSSDDSAPLRTNANRSPPPPSRASSLFVRSGGAPATAPPKGLESLVSEKKQLHSYLKAFEKWIPPSLPLSSSRLSAAIGSSTE
jgi:hypothetical protein